MSLPRVACCSSAPRRTSRASADFGCASNAQTGFWMPIHRDRFSEVAFLLQLLAHGTGQPVQACSSLPLPHKCAVCTRVKASVAIPVLVAGVSLMSRMISSTATV